MGWTELPFHFLFQTLPTFCKVHQSTGSCGTDSDVKFQAWFDLATLFVASVLDNTTADETKDPPVKICADSRNRRLEKTAFSQREGGNDEIFGLQAGKEFLICSCRLQNGLFIEQLHFFIHLLLKRF